ncbi:MFS transporter, FHS family, L-fucose permease [Mucilaginibacter pineti]|uniref:MFS transporter, FHS family, L-fucose permease n=1 Tax=Mucilaginibacter pineti TaxID=1391627 RepID=A0A1G7D9X2_9SPHI|nr:L-fucose:H+ symporter permease [Mucilaginibacter pineti]SDE48313.1 MFS transporter, FHS family, L-fucose permease [Mucilaginibacter pineti]
MSTDKKLFAVGLITSLFFVWGFALNLNPILIPHLKKACQLTDLQSSLVDSASYIGYFVMAIPAGLFMKKFGYKGGIILGLTLCAVGAFLFYPAASVRSYAFFLSALFIIACGLAFLETAANPYITALGDPESAAFRLNFAQSFNGLAASAAPYIGGMVILSATSLTAKQESTMLPSQLNEYLNKEASTVQVPFLIIGAVVLILAVVLYKTSLPEIVEEEEDSIVALAENSFSKRLTSLFKEKNLMRGVLAQFFYVGAQVCVSSFFIRFAGRVAGIEQQLASKFLAVALAGFMAGRFIGTFLMKFINPVKLLAIYSIINIFLIALAVVLHGKFSVYALMGVEFFMSIMFPTIFSLSIRGLGAKTKLGSSLVIMAIVGGAVFPPILGLVSDITNIQIAYLVPAACFVFVFYFAMKNFNAKPVKLTVAH